MEKGIKKYMPLLHELVKRDLKLKYRRSVLGYLWSLLNPLLMMLIMTIVFSYMFRFDIPNYPLYLICGQTLFNFFNESTSMAMYSVIQNGLLIKKVYVPKYIFPISKVISSFVTMSFSLVAILIVMLVTRTAFHLSMLLFWAPLLMLLIFSCGVGMILSALFVFFRDITYLYDIFTLLLNYMSAIFYKVDAFSPMVQRIFLCNPVYCYIRYFRVVVLEGGIPSLPFHLLCAFYALLAAAAGGYIYKKYNHSFLYYV